MCYMNAPDLSKVVVTQRREKKREKEKKKEKEHSSRRENYLLNEIISERF